MSTVPTIARTTDIHPEIPFPHWATLRYLDDEDRIVVDEAEFAHGDIDIELSRAYLADGTRHYAENISLWWHNNWPGERPERQTLTVLPDGIPALIEALQVAQARMANAPRTLRRNPDATAELALLDG